MQPLWWLTKREFRSVDGVPGEWRKLAPFELTATGLGLRDRWRFGKEFSTPQESRAEQISLKNQLVECDRGLRTLLNLREGNIRVIDCDPSRVDISIFQLHSHDIDLLARLQILATGAEHGVR